MSVALSSPSLVQDTRTTEYNPWLVAVVVSMATFMEVMDVSIANVSLRHIGGSMGASYDESTWVLTSYLVANAVILPISGWLASVLGRKKFYMICVAIFTVSSLLCGLAPSLGWLLFFRVVQGMGGGGLAPSEQAILADSFKPSQRGMAFALYGLAVVCAPAIGPTLGGWITDNYSWRWIFFINIPVGILSLLLSGRIVRDSKHAVEEHIAVWKDGLKIDYIGFGLVALGIGCLQVMLDKGQEDDWFGSHFIRLFALLAFVGIAGTIIWELWIAKDPVVNLRLLGRRSFLFSNILMFTVGFVLNSTTVLIPQFVQQLLGYNATQAGMILMGGGLTLMGIMPFVGIATKFIQPKWILFCGLCITCASLFHLTGFDTEVSFNHLVWARVFQCIGMPMFFVPLNTIAYSDLPKGQSNNASALMNLMRNLGGGVGISVAVTMLDRRTQFHMDRIAAHLSAYDYSFQTQLHDMVQLLISQGTAPAQATAQAMSSMYNIALQQATMLSYLDVFKMGTVGCIPLIVVAACMRRVKMGAHSDAAAH